MKKFEGHNSQGLKIGTTSTMFTDQYWRKIDVKCQKTEKSILSVCVIKAVLENAKPPTISM